MLHPDHRDLALTPVTTTAEIATCEAMRQQLARVSYDCRVAYRPCSADVTLGPIPVSRTFYRPRGDVMQALATDYAQTRGRLSQRLVLRRYLRLLAAEPGLSWAAFCDEIAQLPAGQLWHHNHQGDLPGDPLALELDAEPLERLLRANRGKRAFSFTRYHPQYGHNADLIAAANQQGFTLNLVADSLTEADELLGWQVAPVVVKVPEDTRQLLHTPAGNPVVRCPQKFRPGVTCATCQRCAHYHYHRPDRDRSIVAFPIPGLKAADIPPDILAKMM